MVDLLNMSGRVVIVTGGTKGIGRGIALRFLTQGADVVISARNEPKVPIAAAEKTAVFMRGDVRKLEDIEQIVQNTRARFGRIDVLVNNAGGSPAADSATVSPRFSQSIIELNLIAPLNFSQKANAVMQEQPDGGCLINISSTSGTRPSPKTAAYGAAKAGLLSLTQSLAFEWAPKVRVNAVIAGMIETEESESYYGGAVQIAAAAASIPFARLGQPDDVAGACLYLASPLARYVSGASILVHGGGEGRIPGAFGGAR